MRNLRKFYWVFMNKLFSVLFVLLFSSCHNSNGLFGHSQSREDAKASGKTVIDYVPNKKIFKLLDGTKMQIDTAWTEISFTYKNGNKIFDSTYGYNFAVPYKREDPESFSFNFGLADTTNRMFTNGREEKTCQLHPLHLYDEMKVILKQKNPDTSKGWLNPIVTDTIIFKKIEASN